MWHRCHSYSPFRSWNFDACVVVLLDAHTYDVARAIELPVEGVQELAREVKWIKGFRIFAERFRQQRLACGRRVRSADGLGEGNDDPLGASDVGHPP